MTAAAAAASARRRLLSHARFRPRRDPRLPNGELGGGVRLASRAPLPHRPHAQPRRRGLGQLPLLACGCRPQPAVGEAVRTPSPYDLRAQEAADRDALPPAGAARRSPLYVASRAPFSSARPPSSLQVAMYVDLHGHSRKQAAFMYGCAEKGSVLLQQIFPLLLSKVRSASN